MLDTVQGIRDTAMNKISKIPSWECYILVSKVNKIECQMIMKATTNVLRETEGASHWKLYQAEETISAKALGKEHELEN